MTSELSGVILAAGKQVHMAPLSGGRPKPLLPIGNVPVAQHHLAAMAEVGLRRVVMAVGEHADLFRAELEVPPGVEVEYVIRDEALGIAHALYQVGASVEGSFVLALGDVFALPLSLRPLLDAFAGSDVDAVIAVRDDSAGIARNFAVVVDSDGTVRRVYEKATHAATTLKGIGLYVFDECAFDALRRTPRTAVRDCYELTDAIQLMINDGHRVISCSDFSWDVNLGTPRDLLHANLAYLHHHSIASAVDSAVAIPDGCVIEHSAIGPDVILEGAATIRESVVLPGSRIAAGASIERCVVTADGMLPFPS